MMFSKVLLLALTANLLVTKSQNATLGTVRAYLPGVNDVIRMFKPGLIEILWNTPHINGGKKIPNADHDKFQIANFTYLNTTATLNPNGYYGYLNVTNLIFAYEYTYVDLYDGTCEGDLAPEVQFNWVLLQYRVRVNAPCSVQVEALQPLLGPSSVLDLKTRDFSGCSLNQLNTFSQDFLDVVADQIQVQMPLVVDSFLVDQFNKWLPGWRKIVSNNPPYVLRFFPCLPSFSMTTKQATLGVSVQWNNTNDVIDKVFHMNSKKKKSTEDILREAQLYLCAFLGMVIGVLSVFGGDKYIQKRKKAQI